MDVEPDAEIRPGDAVRRGRLVRVLRVTQRAALPARGGDARGAVGDEEAQPVAPVAGSAVLPLVERHVEAESGW